MIVLILFSVFTTSLGQLVGTPTDIYAYPYTASVTLNGQHICAGAIISEEYAVTSVSCLDLGTGTLKLRVGSSYPNHDGEVVSIEKIIKHPKYSSTTKDFDLALLKFFSKIQFDYSKQAVVLPEEDEIFQNNEAGVITTWAWTDNIRTLEASIVSLDNCNKAWSHIFPVPKGLGCAYVGKGGMDSCFEDFGSPLVVHGKLFGVSSIYSQCTSGLPRMYASAVAGRKFIKDVAGV